LYAKNHKEGKGSIVANTLSKRHVLVSTIETKLFSLEFLK